MPNTRLGVRRRVEEGLNSHGERVSSGWGPVVGIEEGLADEQPDSTWRMGLDPSLWPIRQGDLVISATGESWLVQTSNLLQNSFDSTVDWVRVTGQLRINGVTLPPDGWNVARYAATVGENMPDPDGGPVRDEAGLWTGNGPPPSTDFGAEVGDEYMDLASGTIYTFGGAP